MASPVAAACAALFALAFFWTVGLPLALRLLPYRSLAVAAAPTLGFAVFTALALPILCIVGFGTGAVAALAALALTAAFAALSLRPATGETAAAAVPVSAYLIAALAAAATAFALLPKETADGVLLAAPIFDHSKVAIVDEIARNGVPAQNPFYAVAGAPSGLAYYYLWHFGAAMLSLLPCVSGWDADVALTAVTAFATLALTMGLAVRLSDRRAAAFWTIALFLTGSARPLLRMAFGDDVFGTWLSDYPGLAGALVQATWAPQHVAAGACVVVATLLIERLANDPNRLTAPTLGLVAAAGFGSSIWVGGFAFAVGATLAGLVLIARMDRSRRLPFIARVLAAVAVAGLAAAPILIEQIRAAGLRPAPFPIALHPWEVLGPSVPDALRRALDLPAYWTVLLPMDLPAVYPIGVAALAGAFFARGEKGLSDLTVVLAIVALSSLGLASIATSTVLNNDLGWRAVLPSILALSAFAAAGLARWTASPSRIAALPAIGLLLIALADGARFIAESAHGRASTSAGAFARSQALWEAVRRLSAPTDRIANNPRAFATMTPWPANVSWALLADRRSCYAGWEFARAFASLSAADVDRLDAEVRAVFDGKAPVGAARSLFTRHDCKLAIVTASDGAWIAGSFDADPFFELAAQAEGEWRVYKFKR